MSVNSDNIVIRQAEIEDVPSIVKAWRRAYSKTFGYKYPQRWVWMFDKNPFLLNDKNLLPIWIGIDEDRVVAWTCSMAVNIEVNNKTYLSGFDVDTHTLSNYRRKRIGIKLQAANQHFHKIYLCIHMSPGNRRNKYRIGGISGVPFEIYFKLIGNLNGAILYGTLLSSIKVRLGSKGVGLFDSLKKLGVDKISVNLLSKLMKMKQAQHKQINSSFKSNLAFTKVNCFGSQTDDFWDRCRVHYALSVRRDSRYLNWKYVDQPHLNYQRYLVYKNSKICGILIYRLGEPPELPVGIITELFTDEDNIEDISSILEFAETNLKRQGAQMIRCGTSRPILKRCLERASFQKIGACVPVIHINKELIKSLKYENIVKGPWLMSMGDQDIDQPFLYDQPSFAEIMRILTGKIPGSEFIPTKKGEQR